MLIPNYYCKDYILCQCGHWSLFLRLCSANVLIEISLNAGNLQVLANWHWSSTCQACTVPKDQPKKKLRVLSSVFWACVLSWAHTWFSKFPHLQSCFYFLKRLKKYLFLFIWLCWVLVTACRIFNLGCRMWDLVPWSQIQPEPPALGMRSLSPWITRGVPIVAFHCPNFPKKLSPVFALASLLYVSTIISAWSAWRFFIWLAVFSGFLLSSEWNTEHRPLGCSLYYSAWAAITK